jgi:ABC-type transport system involved in multi-copper enzyme maturation permease subunit
MAMLAMLIQKELKATILSPKFTASFAVLSVLILLSVYTGVREYKVAVEGWETSAQLADQQAREATSWRGLSYKTLRAPDPMQIFVSGLNHDIGRWSDIESERAVKLRHSAYSDDPIFAVFRFVDFAFIVQVVLSLFAILFTYDAVNGEREGGTLRLVFSNSVPRARYLIAKCTGSWLGLVVPVSIPTLLLVLSLLFFSFFITLGVLISTLTRRSNVSFLVSLVVWVFLVLIIPRAGILAAGQLVNVPRVAEIEGQRDGYAKDLWAEHYKGMEERWQDAHESGESCEAAMWARMQMEDSLRRDVEVRIEEYESKLLDDLRFRKAAQERLAFTLARFSPVSAYQLGAMSLAGTGISMKSRYEKMMSDYRTRFNDYCAAKQAASDGPDGGLISITVSSDDGFKIGTGRDVALDVSGMPRFSPEGVTFREAFAPLIFDLGILGFAILVTFLGSFLAFLRYDLR